MSEPVRTYRVVVHHLPDYSRGGRDEQLDVLKIRAYTAADAKTQAEAPLPPGGKLGHGWRLVKVEPWEDEATP